MKLRTKSLEEINKHELEGLRRSACTVGRDIVFAQGQYVPDSEAGRRLLAHELTHVIQQDSGSGAGAPVQEHLAISDLSDYGERIAEEKPDEMMRDDVNAPSMPIGLCSSGQVLQRRGVGFNQGEADSSNLPTSSFV